MELERLISLNYDREVISPECREAVISLLLSPPEREYSLNFIKGLTKVGHRMFLQDCLSLPPRALSTLVTFHERGIALADALHAKGSNDLEYIRTCQSHLKSHLAHLLLDLDILDLFKDDSSRRQALGQAYELAYSAAAQTWSSGTLYSLMNLQYASQAALRLWNLDGHSTDSAEKIYRSLAGQLVLSRKFSLAEVYPQKHQKTLQRKAFIAREMARFLKPSVSSEQDIVLWGYRAYASVKDVLRECELNHYERANHLFDLTLVTEHLAKTKTDHQIPFGILRRSYREDFLEYVSQHQLRDELKDTVAIAESLRD
ncbi:hypothetical protein HY496_03145 [Candidatus Woesearchaeota archaeon]|nr:hypothetical protein [Candidatus Woesearchaeota archaeon]